MHRFSAPPERPYRPSARRREQTVAAPPPMEKKVSSGYGTRSTFQPLRTTMPRASKKDAARSEMLFNALLSDHHADRDPRDSPRAAGAARDVWKTNVVSAKSVGGVAAAAEAARRAFREALADVDDEPPWRDRGRNFSMTPGSGDGSWDDDASDGSGGSYDDDDASYDAAEDWWRRHNSGETLRARPASKGRAAARTTFPAIRSPRAAKGAAGGPHQIPPPRNRPAVADADKVRGAKAHAKWEGPPPDGRKPSGRPPRPSANAAAPPSSTSSPRASGRAPAKAARKKTNLYDILGVKVHAERAEIKRAYVDLALKLHPDKNSDEGANAQFLRVKEAYATLVNADDRRAYDRSLIDARGSS